MKAKVIQCKRYTHSGCIGMEGEILEEYDFNGRHFYKIEATNQGGYTNATKKYRMWQVGNNADFLKEELEFISP